MYYYSFFTSLSGENFRDSSTGFFSLLLDERELWISAVHLKYVFIYKYTSRAHLNYANRWLQKRTTQSLIYSIKSPKRNCCISVSSNSGKNYYLPVLSFSCVCLNSQHKLLLYVCVSLSQTLIGVTSQRLEWYSRTLRTKHIFLRCFLPIIF